MIDRKNFCAIQSQQYPAKYCAGKDAGTSEQQYKLASANHCRTVQEALAGGVVTQMAHQHLRTNRFLDASENAVKTQNGCTVSTYVLIAIIKKMFYFKVSLYTLLQILSVSIFEKPLSSCALQPDSTKNIAQQSDNQLILFDF